jgi:TRAP-type C4-dicarboxylate transport system permease small subunit
MLAVLGRLYHGLINALAALAAILIVISIGLVVLNVASRSLGYGSFQATIAITEYILLYFTLFSAPYLLNTRGHVMVDMAVKNLRGLPRRILESIIYLIGITVSMIFLVVSIGIMRNAIARGHFDERSIDLPYWLLYAGFPLCFGLLTIEFLRYLLTSRSLYDSTDTSEGL